MPPTCTAVRQYCSKRTGQREPDAKADTITADLLAKLSMAEQ